MQLRTMIAYDLETTRIKAGETPRPLYLTAFCDTWACSARVQDTAHLRELLEARFLVPEFNRCRFVAWNGNNFDVYLIAQALLASDAVIIRPYLTRSKNLRGMKIIAKRGKDAKGRALWWEFLDGISMTGLTATTLKKFLATFAPEYQKLEGPDFEREEFNADNPDHVRYAERDSEGLYWGMQKAEQIVRDNFGVGLQPTVGNLGIKIFQGRMPRDVTIWTPSLLCLNAIRGQVLRGGFCSLARKFNGPIWKYDLNQAYAAAMRDARLPAGRCYWSPSRPNPYARVYISRVEGTNQRNVIPFYFRDMEGTRGDALEKLPPTWLTSIEINQLRAEGWQLTVGETYYWDDDFSMKDFVTELEALRGASDGGPSGAQGTMIKMIGNNAYGKTVERLDGVELVMALDCPEGFSAYQAEDDRLNYVWFRFGAPALRDYHQPQLGSFITAHVRMVVRRAILQAPHAWLYADTDCVAFTEPVTLPIDPVKYGAWKCENAGTEFYLIAKKVYADQSSGKIHAKGMNVKRLTMEQMRAWHAGTSPEQVQTQRQNFVKFVGGGPMFAERRKVGQRFAAPSAR